MKFLNHIEEYLLAICLLSMVIINFADVFLRSLFHSSLSFSGELLMILFVWVVLLGVAIGYKQVKHISLPIVFDVLSVFYKKILIVFSGIVTFVFIMSLVISGYQMIAQQILFSQKTAVLQMPEWIAGVSIPIGSLFILVRLIQSTVGQISEVKEVRQK